MGLKPKLFLEVTYSSSIFIRDGLPIMALDTSSIDPCIHFLYLLIHIIMILILEEAYKPVAYTLAP